MGLEGDPPLLYLGVGLCEVYDKSHRNNLGEVAQVTCTFGLGFSVVEDGLDASLYQLSFFAFLIFSVRCFSKISLHWRTSF